MINSFRGEFSFLSNFYPVEITYHGICYPTVEHAFQAAKTSIVSESTWVLSADTPGQAKRRGRKVTLREDWGTVKLSVMEELLRLKFAIPSLLVALSTTEGRELVEGNTWNDTFWGVCRCVGENHLGKLLMKIRSEIKI